MLFIYYSELLLRTCAMGEHSDVEVISSASPVPKGSNAAIGDHSLIATILTGKTLYDHIPQSQDAIHAGEHLRSTYVITRIQTYISQ